MRLTVLAILLVICSSVIGAEENTYQSQMLGFSVTKPASWRFQSANTYLNQARQSKLKDPEMQKRWEETMRAPLVVIAKYPLDYPDINTTFKADAKPYGQVPRGSAGVDIINAILPFFKANFTDLQIIQGPLEVTLAGHKAGYIKINYLNVAANKQYPSTSELWVVPRPDYFFMLGGGYSRSAPDATNEIAEVLKTLVIE